MTQKRKSDEFGSGKPHPKDPVNMIPLPVEKRKCVWVKNHVATQTDAIPHRKTVTTTTRYSDGDRSIEVIEVEEFVLPE